jgi:hypothetical protein
MTAQVFATEQRPAEALEALVARHGVLRVILAIPAVLVGWGRVTRLGHEISPHLARDIGLTHEPPSKTYAEYR